MMKYIAKFVLKYEYLVWFIEGYAWGMFAMYLIMRYVW